MAINTIDIEEDMYSEHSSRVQVSSQPIYTFQWLNLKLLHLVSIDPKHAVILYIWPEVKSCT